MWVRSREAMAAWRAWMWERAGNKPKPPCDGLPCRSEAGAGTPRTASACRHRASAEGGKPMNWAWYKKVENA